MKERKNQQPHSSDSEEMKNNEKQNASTSRNVTSDVNKNTTAAAGRVANERNSSVSTKTTVTGSDMDGQVAS